jgi:DNA-binding MarR family transcriptional regulator
MTEPTEQQVTQFGRFIKTLASRYLWMEIDLAEGATDLGKSELLVIELMAWNDCHTTSQVSRAGKMPLSSASWLIDRLVERGYVSRKRSQTDRRVVELSLTPRGEETIAHMDRAFESMARDLLAIATEEERAALLAVAGRLETE